MARKKSYTQEEALEEIFYNNEEALTPTQLVYKHRLYNGSGLTQKTIDALLKEFNFVIKKRATYTKIV